MISVQKSIIIRNLMILLPLSMSIPLLPLAHAQPKPTDPSYVTWWQHYFQGNIDGMNNKKVPGQHSDAYNKGWKDGYQSVYGVYVPMPQGKSTEYVKGYRIGYTSGKDLAANGNDVSTDEIPDICHGYSSDWCHGWQDGYKVGWNSAAK